MPVISGRTSCAASSASARSNASPGFCGVDDTFATRVSPSDLRATASVKVPPVATATIQVALVTDMLRCQRSYLRHGALSEQPQRPPLKSVELFGPPA